MELPVLSPCGHWTMVDWENLKSRPLDKLHKVSFYTCQVCNVEALCWYSTLQLEDSMRRLASMPPNHPSFWYYFVKARKRAEEIQKRGRNIKLADS